MYKLVTMDAMEKALNLPNILEEIVANVFPKKRRRDLMTVSQAFYDAVCKLEEPKCKMSIYCSTVSKNMKMKIK